MSSETDYTEDGVFLKTAKFGEVLAFSFVVGLLVRSTDSSL